MGEGLQENEVNAIGNREKWSPCYVVAGSLSILSPEVTWKVEKLPNELVM